jgi:hypothetical protein
VTDSSVLVLTDDELTCIAASSSRAWPLPLGPSRDSGAVVTSALAGERSLIARGLLGRRDGGYVLGEDAVPFLGPGLGDEPEAVLFVADQEFRWALQGMSVAWYRQEGADVLEVRAANGLHHFTMPTPEGLARGVRRYVEAVHESGFPDAVPGAALSLCVVLPRTGSAFRVGQGTVTEAAAGGRPLSSAEWRPATLERVLSALFAS